MHNTRYNEPKYTHAPIFSKININNKKTKIVKYKSNIKNNKYAFI